MVQAYPIILKGLSLSIILEKHLNQISHILGIKSILVVIRSQDYKFHRKKAEKLKESLDMQVQEMKQEKVNAGYKIGLLQFGFSA